MEPDRRYCMKRVRTHDYDRYFASLLAPAGACRGLIALYAFNLELASVGDLVSEAPLGEIRLQWWRDALAEAREGLTPRHAVVAELARILHVLPPGELERLIGARSRDFDDAAECSAAALEAYARNTAGTLAGLAWRACFGGSRPPEALEDAGTAWGLAGLLRMASFRARNPRAAVVPNGLTGRSGHSAVRAAVAVSARDLLVSGRAGLGRLDRPGRAVVGYLPVARQYLRRLERADEEIDAPGLEPSRTARQLAMLWAVTTGRF